MRSVKIISDGTPANTRIVDSQTGEEIQGVTRITWQLDATDRIATATVDFIVAHVDVEADLVGDQLEADVAARERFLNSHGLRS